jgi:undecaprenyl-diphosphatase
MPSFIVQISAGDQGPDAIECIILGTALAPRQGQYGSPDAAPCIEETRMEAVQAYDLGILYFFGSLHRPWLDPIVQALTHLGDYAVVTGVVVAAVGAFLLLRRQRYAAIVVGVALLALAVEWTAKLIVQRDRPNVNWRLIPLPDEPSFPSGHALCAMAIYGCIGLLAAQLVSRRWRWLPIAAGIGMGMMIGLTRVYLGVHYPIDVLGGWIAGLACALLGSTLAEENQPAPEAPPPASPPPPTS